MCKILRVNSMDHLSKIWGRIAISLDKKTFLTNKGLDDPYFDLQAKVDLTQHPGGLESTKKLIDLCHITNASSVLDVGCGVGKTVCYLAKTIGCKVYGVDKNERMIKKANERAKRNKIEHLVNFIIADAQKLPFPRNHFDCLISESVTAFIEGKRKALNEYVHVTKPGGYVGLNEVTWIKENPPKSLIKYLIHNANGTIPESPNGWKKLLEDSGLGNIITEIYPFNYLNQKSEDLYKAWHRFMALYFKESSYRKHILQIMIGTWKMPDNLFEYMGYGIYVGKKR